MKIGTHIPHFGRMASPDAIVTAAQTAERLGFDSVWTIDHVVIPTRIESKYPGTTSGKFIFRGDRDLYEPLPVMAFLAAKTRRVRIGVGVLVVPHRNPVVTAKQLATIDALSKGRLIVGVGVGWMAEEFQALHTAPFKDRGRVTDEYLEIFRKLWTGDPVSHDGTYYQFDEIQSNPKPANPDGIPIWVGGYSRPAFRRAAKFGNGWHGMNFGPDTIGGAIAQVRQAAETTGRPATDLTMSTLMNFDASGTPLAENPLAATERGRLLLGTTEEKVEQIRAFERAGIDNLLVAFTARDLDGYLREMEAFARDVLAQVG